MKRSLVLLFLLWIVPFGRALAQESTALVSDAASNRPSAFQLDGFRFEYQGWNNCGPATLTNALTFFGYTDNQQRAAHYLKPNGEDKNVTPREMVSFVNWQVPELSVFALTRIGGDLDLLKTLLANRFPIIIEEGYDPPPHDLGWMGHYLLLIGYDDAAQHFVTLDSYEGPNQYYGYDHINEYWRHFNRRYIVLYDSGREPELLELLGTNADLVQNALNALEKARDEATHDPEDPYVWFNLGSSYVALADIYAHSGYTSISGDYEQQAYQYAVVAYDEARKLGLPWRMMWYQFGPLEAYNAVGRYDDTLKLTSANLSDGGGQWVEETFYYAGVAREGMGETARALDNYKQAVFLNSNYAEARAAMDRLQAPASS
ncbi:MAG: C39 family peptidase [Anaerolineae bacterium]|nr:C39 family peptidase [Anaerolineae bacterium]